MVTMEGASTVATASPASLFCSTSAISSALRAQGSFRLEMFPVISVCFIQSTSYFSSRSRKTEAEPPAICYDQARLMLSVTYFDPIGIHFYPEKTALPDSRGICRGVGRAGNLDMLESMDDLVMVSCHVHSKIMARNELAAVPIQPEHMAYEDGYAAKAGAAQDEGLQFLLMEICREVQKELS